MKVKKLSGKVQDAQQIPTLFDHENKIGRASCRERVYVLV